MNRLAKLFSRADDPGFVAATSIVEHVAEDSMDIFMARNLGFHDKDRKRLKEDKTLINVLEKSITMIFLRGPGKLCQNVGEPSSLTLVRCLDPRRYLVERNAQVLQIKAERPHTATQTGCKITQETTLEYNYRFAPCKRYATSGRLGFLRRLSGFQG